MAMLNFKGFTLIELLVVLFIIAIASSLVFLSVGRGLLGTKDKGLLNKFGQTLSLARSKSIGQGRAVNLLIYGEERAFGIEGEDRFTIPEDVEIRGEGVEEFDEGIYSITFYPDGSSTGGTIIFSMPDGTLYRFEINKFFGSFKVEKDEG